MASFIAEDYRTMKQLISHLSQQLPNDLQLLEQMVNMESPSLEKPFFDRFVRFAGSQFEALGGEVQYVPAERFGDHLLVDFQESLRNPFYFWVTPTPCFPQARRRDVRSRLRTERLPDPACLT